MTTATPGTTHCFIASVMALSMVLRSTGEDFSSDATAGFGSGAPGHTRGNNATTPRRMTRWGVRLTPGVATPGLACVLSAVTLSPCHFLQPAEVAFIQPGVLAGRGDRPAGDHQTGDLRRGLQDVARGNHQV